MGKVTIVVHEPSIPSTEMEELINKQLDHEDIMPDYPNAVVLVTPADEEWAKL